MLHTENQGKPSKNLQKPYASLGSPSFLLLFVMFSYMFATAHLTSRCLIQNLLRGSSRQRARTGGHSDQSKKYQVQAMLGE